MFSTFKFHLQISNDTGVNNDYCNVFDLMPACIFGKDILDIPLKYTQREINEFAQTIVYNMFSGISNSSAFDFCNGQCTVMGINNYDLDNTINAFHLAIPNSHCTDSFSVDKETW